MKCKDKMRAIPKHKERSKTIKYGKLYDIAGLRDKNLQEQWGQITRSANCAFRENSIDIMFENPAKLESGDVGYNIKTIHCCIDPNGGGKNRTAIVIGYLNERSGEVVVSYFFFIYF